MRRALVFLLLLRSAPSSFACIQVEGITLKGKISMGGETIGDDFVRGLYQGRPRQFWEEERIRLADAKGNRAMRNGHAVALLHLGRVAEAIGIFTALEREKPGEYAIAANLGTAYELAGDNAQALRWIAEGIRRNPQSHAGTEWLHVRILEAKLAATKDPQWFAKNSVLGLDFGNALVPTKPRTRPPGNRGNPVTAAALSNALSYQLHERLQFVVAPDPVVANLFFDWASLEMSGGFLENAQAFYREAVKFGVSRPHARERLAYVQALLAKYKKNEPPVRAQTRPRSSGR